MSRGESVKLVADALDELESSRLSREQIRRIEALLITGMAYEAQFGKLKCLEKIYDPNRR